MNKENKQEAQNKELAHFTMDKLPIPDVVYHYTSKETLKKIFLEDGVSFLLTNITNFPDKLEGKCGEVFWDIAINELFDENIISAKDLELFRNIEIPKHGFIYKPKKNGINIYKSGASDVFIGCFSQLKDDERMIKEYIRNEKNKGACIGLYSRRLLDWRYGEDDKNGYNVSLMPVLYGCDAVEHIKSKVTELIKITSGTETEKFKNFGPGLLKNMLSSIVFETKLSKYEHEKEYRIVLHCPKDVPKGYEVHQFDQDENKRGKLFKILKTAVESVSFVNLDTTEKDELTETLKKRQYHYLS